MKTFVSLLKREWLEHGRTFTWAPLVVLALIVIGGLQFSPAKADLELQIDGDETLQIHDDSAQNASPIALFSAVVLDVAGATDQELQDRLGIILKYVATPFYWVYLIIALFALVGSLHEERKDRSILFFKSMPVSDVQTVLSKYAFVAWVAPLVTLAVIVAAQLFILTLFSIHVEDGLGGRVWSNSGLLGNTLQTLYGFFLNGFALLPIFAWFMLISGWASSIPFVWALGIPFWLSVFERIVMDTNSISSLVAYHGRMPTLPRAWMDAEVPFFDVGLTTVAEQAHIFMHSRYWAGAALGVVFLAGAIYLRRRRNEI